MKDIKRFILESSINEFSCHISQVDSGKYNDMLLFKKIQKSLESKKDTNISVDCGKAGVCYIEFSNFGHNIHDYSCDFRMRLKDLGKYMNSKEVDSEWTAHQSWQDIYQIMLNILGDIQRKIGS